MTHVKLKSGCKLMRDIFFKNSTNQLEKKKARQRFKNVVEYFLGNRRRLDYKDSVQNLLENL
jgi:hypothetical protein